MLRLVTQCKNVVRTTTGALIGFVIGFFCWIAMGALAEVDKASHWKGTMILFAFVLPVACVVGGAYAVQAHPKRLNYAVANILITALATLLTVTAVITLIPLPFWIGLLLTCPIYVLLRIVENRFIAASVNAIIGWLEDRSPRITA